MGLGFAGSSGGVRNGVLIALDNDGDDEGGSEMFGGGRDACCVGEDGAEGTRGEGDPLMGEGGCSAELREAVGDAGERLRVRANGDGG